MNYTEFINNAALLILLSILSGYFRYQWQKDHTTKTIGLGVLYGLFAVVAMSMPMRLVPGAIFDGRSIILALAGLFETPGVVLIAAGIGILYRIYLGGVGMLTGVGSLIIAGAIGLLFKIVIQKRKYALTPLRLLLLGIVTHTALLIWFVTLPRDTFLIMIRYYSLYYLFIFSVTTMLIGIFMESQEQRQRSERHLANSEKRYRELVTNLHEGIWLVDQNQLTTYVNPSMAEMLGYTCEEMLGRSLYKFMEKKYHRDAKKHAERRKQGMYEQYERDFLRKDGSILHGILSVASVLDDQGEYAGSLAGIQDITQRVIAEKKLEEQSHRLEEIVNERTRELESAQAQLIRAEKLAALGGLAGSVGHELRNPLSVIANAVYLLRLSLKDADQKTTEYLRLIDEETRTASRIISELLDYSRIRISQTEAVGLPSLIQDLLVEIPVPEGILLELELSNRLPRVEVNPQQVNQILTNLVANACQAMPQGGTLAISAKRRKGKVILTVKDSGEGIPEEHITRLFEPLFTTRTKGIGLGLALSKKLADMNNISIDVESRVGQGSVFTLTFPVSQSK